jgi:ribonuclease-3
MHLGKKPDTSTMKDFLPPFTDLELLVRALTHRSALNEGVSSSKISNERLEFLGDAVLELATTKFLFFHLPNDQEGVLTAYRSALVKTSTLAATARKLELGERILMSKGEESTGGRDNDSLLADTMEAVIGAIYIDQGFEAAEKFLAEHLFPLYEEIKEQKLYQDAKSLLQETVQGKGLSTPAYQVINEDGPDHDKEFTVQVMVDKKVVGTGQGKSKQLAQQAAARQALEKITKQ